MAQISKNKKNKKEAAAAAFQRSRDPRVLWAMSEAPTLDSDSCRFQILPAVFSTAIIILIVRMVSYSRPMDQFYWSAGNTELIDIFSYGKMVALLACAAVVLLILLFRLLTQSLIIKRSAVYIPMLVYSCFVLLSYLTSDNKEFSLLGYNDRFEGTLPLLAYMVLLFFIINTVDGERSVRWMIRGLVVSSVLLSLLGISQALDMDFFRTTIGQKLLVPNYPMQNGLTSWQAIDAMAAEGEQFLGFTFNHKEIYQTVYNINYVSFYLTLLIPLFGMLFIRSFQLGKDEALWKKIAWGVLFALVVYNLIGSASSGGYLGMAAVVIFALLLFNKRIAAWWKPMIVLIAITIGISGITVDRWLPELTQAIRGVTPSAHAADDDTAKNPGELSPCHIDSIVTGENYVDFSINGELFSVVVKEKDGVVSSFVLEDPEGNLLPLLPTDTDGVYAIGDDRFIDYATVSYALSDGIFHITVGTYGQDWHFPITEEGVMYRNGYGNYVSLGETEAVGFQNNQSFGSGRGYIWSRTLPMMKDTAIIGYGADTYALHFPQNDYVGKYNSGSFTNRIDIIVDKPHNMYMGSWIGTGGISVIALLCLFGIYLFQSIRLYAKRSFAQNDLLTYTGAGITLGIFGFLISALVNDSSVSVMSMFYGLLGLGIAINMILSHRADNGTDGETQSKIQPEA